MIVFGEERETTRRREIFDVIVIIFTLVLGFVIIGLSS